MSAGVQTTLKAAGPSAAASQGQAVASFEEVYDAHVEFVWRTGLRLGIPREHVDDLVQDVFLIVHRQLHTFEGRSTLRTWLFGIVARVARRRRGALGAQARVTDVAIDIETILDPREGPFEAARRAEAARAVDRILDAVDDEKRFVFVAIELEHMSPADAAQALGIPVNTVYSRLRHARQQFAAATARFRTHDSWRNP
jgi:RNA polymerase sigma-70 factor (ECF subfamily)